MEQEAFRELVIEGLGFDDDLDSPFGAAPTLNKQNHTKNDFD
jgi:hypothetical protein